MEQGKIESMLAKTRTLFSIPFFAGTNQEFDEVLAERLHHSEEKLPTIVLTPNAEQVVISQKDKNFRFLLQQATYNIPDGAFIVLASHFLASAPLPERIAGVDVVAHLLKKSDHRKMMIIGGRSYKNTDIPWLEGYKNILQPTAAEEEKIISEIEKLRPEIIFVAFGAPNQEKFIFDHYGVFAQQHVKIAMVVGGSFDLLFGKMQRAPIWMQRSGLEWLFRLFQEPWRWKRQLRLFAFAWLLFKEKIGQLLRTFFFTQVHAQ